MQSIKENIHIEDKYAGVTLGAINLPRGIIYIDAPLTPEDARSWRADLLEFESGHQRLLINLDTNIDRIIGARAMDTTILAHEKLTEYFNNRSGSFKLQGQRTGSEWEKTLAVGNIRWALPELTLSEKITLYWGKTPLVFEYHPGADLGAIWLILPEEKIVFLGDTVLKNQPPFIANANLPRWIEDLNLLLSESYQGYTFVSGRGGVCALSTIEKQRTIIEKIYHDLEKLAAKKAEVKETEEMIPEILAPMRFLASEQELFAQRLRYGLKEYYLRHYNNDEE